METKECGRCKQVKSVSDFNKNKTRVDGYHGDCRQCKKEYQAEWYKNHRVEHQARIVRRKKEVYANTRAYIVKIKEETPCADCKINYPSFVMDFDHVTGVKKANVSSLVQRGSEFKTVLAEIEKCEIVCSNCHRIRTFTRSGEMPV